MKLKRAKAAEFFHNIREIQTYLSVRKKHSLLNPSKLINILKLYFESILFYQSVSIGRNCIKLKSGKTYIVLFNGHDSKGKATTIGIMQIAETFINMVCTDLQKVLDRTSFKPLLDLFTTVLQEQRIPYELKFGILNIENKALKEVCNFHTRNLPETKAEGYLEIRKQIVLENIKKTSLILKHKDSFERNVETLYKYYENFIVSKVKNYISHNKIFEGLKILLNELQKSDDQRIVTDIIWNIILYNNLFLLEKKGTVHDLVDEYSNLIKPQDLQEIKNAINFSPGQFEIANFSIALEDYDFTDVNFQKVKTLISFTVPFEMEEDNLCLSANDNINVVFKKITNLFDDPVYYFLDSRQVNINRAMPLTIFSDALPNVTNSTAIRIAINDFYHPDFKVVKGKIKYKDFKEKEALLGRTYYPHKDKAVKVLHNLITRRSGKFPLEMKKEDININLFSNYLVNYVDEHNNSIFHKVYTITNLDSYLKVKKRYLDKINELNLQDEFPNIRKLLVESYFTSSKSLCNFIYKLMDLVVKKSIELRGLYKYLWREDKPLPEPEAQPIIKSHLQPVCEAAGIQISREIVCAGGSLDFHCCYTRDGNLYKTCIEMKNAHHKDLLQGLTKQLPEYMKDESTKDGIYFVLWYKCSEFLKPTRFNSTTELQKYLEESVPDKYRIKILIIDCTKKEVPSKL